MPHLILPEYFAALVSSGTGNAPLHVPEGPDTYDAFREFSPVAAHSVKALLMKLDVSKSGGPETSAPPY